MFQKLIDHVIQGMQDYAAGRQKQWNGLLEWNNGLDYWIELFSFFGQVSEFILGSLLLMIYKYLATMDDCNNDNHCLLQCFHK